MFHIFAFSRNLCYAFLSFTVVNYNYVWEGGGISFLHFFTMKKKKKNSPIKLITANDLSLCQVSLLLHKLKFANFFILLFGKKKIISIVLIKSNLLTIWSVISTCSLKKVFTLSLMLRLRDHSNVSFRL